MKVEALLKRALIKAHLTVSCYFVCVMFTVRVVLHYKSRLKPQSHALQLFFSLLGRPLVTLFRVQEMVFDNQPTV